MMAFFRRKSGQDAKHGNLRMTCEMGHSHRSKLEGAVCQILQLREKAGEIEILQVEDHVYLTLARIHYIPDFKCRDMATGAAFHVEAKGFPNDRWPMKKKLWKFYGPNKLEIWTGSHLNPKLTETITPESNQTHEDAPGSTKVQKGYMGSQSDNVTKGKTK